MDNKIFAYFICYCIWIWFYRFFPKDEARRSRYLLYQQVAASIIGSVILIFSSVITDAVTSAQNQHALINGLRYFAFVLVLFEIAIQVQAKEYPVPPEPPLPPEVGALPQAVRDSSAVRHKIIAKIFFIVFILR